ncbi:probable E3 ubiquitin-protein ligase RHC1A [Rhagoletis pomonella]|uniref:probable E3 ubiquitin-protein ligase RHC1A n=1 Tax=Rhagoletis pomonella TaxID=28610 RepID=UPI00177F30E7|nr:probable E3 ubiquitin-protein ligase RHC1A [Rhagoletis pomonella]
MSVRQSEENVANLAAPGDSCVICNEETTNFNFVSTPCMHGFHRSCLTIWLTDHDSCPLCRRTIDSQSLRSFSEQELRPGMENSSSQGAVPRNNNSNAGGRMTRSRAANSNPPDRSIQDDTRSPANMRRGRNYRQNRDEQRQAN